MNSNNTTLDHRTFNELLADFKKRIPYYTKDWVFTEEQELGTTLTKAFIHLQERVLEKLNKIPEKSFIEFLNGLGIKLRSSYASNVPVTFQLPEAIDRNVFVKKETLLNAVNEKGEELTFETSENLLATGAKIVQIYSYNNETNEIYDHFISYSKDEPFNIFTKKDNQNMQEHSFYIGHSDLFNIEKDAQITITFSTKSRSDAMNLANLIRTNINWEFLTISESKEQVIVPLTYLPIFDKNITNNTLTVTLEVKDDFKQNFSSEEIEINQIQSRWIRGIFNKGKRHEEKPTNENILEKIKHEERYFESSLNPPQVTDVTINVTKTKPKDADLLFHNNLLIPITGPTQKIFPLGSRPVPNDSFYIASKDAFSKKDYQITLTLNLLTKKEIKENDTTKTYYIPLLENGTSKNINNAQTVLEYWNGSGWIPISDTKAVLKKESIEKITFTCPSDIQELEFNGQTNYWIRIRLVSGNYGEEKFVIMDENGEKKYVKDPNAILPPSIASLKISYKPQLNQQFTPQHFMTFNNLEFEKHDFKIANSVQISKPFPSKEFSVYLGFNKKLIGGPLGFYFVIQPERKLKQNNYKINFYYFSKEKKWNKIVIEDNSQNLTVTDYVKLFIPNDFEKCDLFGANLYWIKLTQSIINNTERELKKTKSETEILNIRQNISKIDRDKSKLIKKKLDEIKKISKEIEREDDPEKLDQLRKNKKDLDEQKQQLVDEKKELIDEKKEQLVEVYSRVPELRNRLYRSRSIENFYLNTVNAKNSFSKLLFFSSNENPEQSFILDEIPTEDSEVFVWINESKNLSLDEITVLHSENKLRENTDSNGSVIERWVKWDKVEDFINSQPNDRHFNLNKTSKRISFGNGVKGKIPPLGNNNVQIRYSTGGGERGIVAIDAINSLKTSVPFVEKIANPKPSEGGLDVEDVPSSLVRGPYTIKNRGKAVCKEDFEWLLREKFLNLKRILCLPAVNSDNKLKGGCVTIVVVPNSTEKKPLPSISMMSNMKKYLKEISSTQIGPSNIYVRSPFYVKLSIDVDIYPTNIEEAVVAEQKAEAKISKFLHPISGGKKGNGWNFGETITFSDLFSLFEKIPEIDHIENLSVKVEYEDEEGRQKKELAAKKGILSPPIPKEEKTITVYEDKMILPPIFSDSLIYGGDHKIRIKFKGDG